MAKNPPKKTEEPEATPQFDDVLKRMLSSPPKQHKVKPEPAPATETPKKPPTAGLKKAPPVDGTTVIDYGPRTLDWDE